MDNIPTWIALTGSIVLSVIVVILIQLFVVPIQKRKILNKLNQERPVKFTFSDSTGKKF